jgi:hypothetical protein
MIVESREELKSPSTEDSLTGETSSQLVSNEKSSLNENDTKTKFINSRKNNLKPVMWKRLFAILNVNRKVENMKINGID